LCTPCGDRSLPAFLGWIVLPTLGDATTIVVLQTPDQVLVAADARAVSLLADSGVPATATRQVCKIVRTPHTVIALAGILGNLSEFDTRGFVQENLSVDTTLENAADRLAQKSIAPLTAVIDGLAHTAPSQTLIIPGRPALSIVLTRFENGGTRVAIRDIVYTGRAAGAPEFRIQSTNCPGDCKGPHMVFAAGASDAVTRFLMSRSVRVRLKDPAFALDLLRVEAAAEPSIVGPPFSVLQGDRTGFRWIEAGACQDNDVTVARSQP